MGEKVGRGTIETGNLFSIMKTLIIINESFAEMFVGKNSTLAYILAATDFSEVYVQNIAGNFCSKITENQAEILSKKYREINQQIRSLSSKIASVKVKELIPENFCDLPEISENDLIIQRLEPMKSPFPPIGEKNLDEFLIDLKKRFPQHIFNCPIGLHDKELDEFLDISTPTIEFTLNDENLAEKLNSMGEAYDKIYRNGQKKIVIKPKNLAQSLGVFSLDLSQKKDLRAECAKHGEKLFHGQILAQPFLEGIRQGDIRANIIKDSQGNFEIAGFVFRKSLRAENDENFTTGFVVGGSTPRSIKDLTKAEQEDLHKKSAKILNILNGKLREKYRDVIELGADFIPVGNGREVLLGEINHHCPGLLPVAEALAEENYQDGFGLVKRFLLSSKKNLKN